jgi:hypothetical protein
MKVGRDVRGTKRSPMNFSAHGSPALAAAPILRMAAAASLLSNRSAMRVARLRSPGSLPRDTLLPGANLTVAVRPPVNRPSSGGVRSWLEHNPIVRYLYDFP